MKNMKLFPVLIWNNWTVQSVCLNQANSFCRESIAVWIPGSLFYPFKFHQVKLNNTTDPRHVQNNLYDCYKIIYLNIFDVPPLCLRMVKAALINI